MPSPITLEQVRNMLPCNKLRLDDELEIQPDIMARISTNVVLMNSRQLEAKDDLARIEGRVLNDLKNDDPKLTVAQLDALVKKDSARVRAWQKYQEARALYEEWTGMLEAWRQKGFSMNKLSDLYAANYFTLDSITSRRGRDTSTQDEARAELRKASTRAEVEETPVRRLRVST